MRTVFIVDGSYYLHSGIFAPKMKLTSPSGEPTTGTYVFTGEILSLLASRRPEYIVVTFDSGERPLLRQQVFEQYKGNRGPCPEELQVQIKRSTEIMDALGVKVLSVPYYEADDVIGTVSKLAEDLGHQVEICTKDKDILQLVTPNVTVWEIKSNSRMDVRDVQDKWGLEPVQMIDFLALQGDSADNIPGVHGIGPKKALDLIHQFGTLEKIYDGIQTIPGKLREMLVKGRDSAFLSKKLATIVRDVPIGVSLEDLKWQGFLMSKVRSLFEELGFRKHMSTVEGNWRL